MLDTFQMVTVDALHLEIHAQTQKLELPYTVTHAQHYKLLAFCTTTYILLKCFRYV